MGHIFDIHSARLYDKWYSSSRGSVLEGFLRLLVRDLLNPLRNERVLDIGCGSGRHLQILDSLGFNLHGVDPSPCMLDSARKRLGNRCEFKKGIVEDLPYDDDEFEYALFINTLEILSDPVRALREAGRVARKKVLVISVNALSPARMGEEVKGFFAESYSNCIKGYSLSGLKSLVRNAYGDVPLSWRGASLPSVFRRPENTASDEGFKANQWPFSYYLGLSVSMRYTMRTNNLFLKRKPENLKRVVGSVSPVSNLKNIWNSGGKNERGLSLQQTGKQPGKV